MKKDELKKEMAKLISEGQFTEEEVLNIYEESSRGTNMDKQEKQSRISNILYYIGGGIVFLGICIFVGSNWQMLNSFTKIFATLGFSVAMYMAGTLLRMQENLEKVADAFHFISGLVAPVGIFVSLDVTGMNMDTAGSHSLVAAIVFGVNLLYYFLQPRHVYFVFSVIFGTWLFFGLTTFLFGGRPFHDWDMIKYRWLTAGITHIVLGFALKDTENKSLTPHLYAVGAFEFLTAAFSLGGYGSSQNILWEILFPGVTFGFIFLSIYLKARSFLIWGCFYLMVHLIKITHEYFSTGFGWSLSLILIGFILIGVGYFAFYLNKRYLSS